MKCPSGWSPLQGLGTLSLERKCSKPLTLMLGRPAMATATLLSPCLRMCYGTSRLA